MSAKTRHNRISARRRLPAFILVLLVVALCIAGVIYKGAEVTRRTAMGHPLVVK